MDCLTKTYCSILLVTLFIATGCVPGSGRLPLHREVKPLPPEQLCRIAVLPFLNDSDYPLGDAIVSKVFAAQLQSSGGHVMIQDGDILRAYQQLRLLPGRAPSLEKLRIIGDRIEAQLLITGIIMEMREDRGEHGTVDPMIVLEVQLRDARDGETLWTVFHRRKGSDYKKTMHFGIIHTLTGLSQQMAVEIINLFYEKGLHQCNELSQP